jgi:hypothetical protein
VVENSLEVPPEGMEAEREPVTRVWERTAVCEHGRQKRYTTRSAGEQLLYVACSLTEECAAVEAAVYM